MSRVELTVVLLGASLFSWLIVSTSLKISEEKQAAKAQVQRYVAATHPELGLVDVSGDLVDTDGDGDIEVHIRLHQ